MKPFVVRTDLVVSTHSRTVAVRDVRSQMIAVYAEENKKIVPVHFQSAHFKW